MVHSTVITGYCSLLSGFPINMFNKEQKQKEHLKFMLKNNKDKIYKNVKCVCSNLLRAMLAP